MVKLEKVTENLQANQKLSSEFKGLFTDLITKFHLAFLDVDLTNLSKKVENVDLNVGNPYLQKRAVSYNTQTNVIELNERELKKPYDQKHLMMIAVMEIIASDKKKDPRFEALYQGLLTVVANNLVGNNGDINPHENEQILFNIVSDITTFDVVRDAFFEGKEASLESKLKQKVNNSSELEKVFEEARYNLYNPSPDVLASVQERLASMIANMDNLDKETFERILSNIIDDQSYTEMASNKKTNIAANLSGVFTSKQEYAKIR